MNDRERKRRTPMAVSEALQGYLTRSGLGPCLAHAQVVMDWATLVGPQVAAVTRAESVAPDGTLFVRVATSAWRNELQLMMPDLMARLNAGRGAGRIKTIRWL